MALVDSDSIPKSWRPSARSAVATMLIVGASLSFHLAGADQACADAQRPGSQRDAAAKLSPPNISEAIRAVRNPSEASLSGSMYSALEAVVQYRSGKQRQKLRASELDPSNFLLTIKTGEGTTFLSDKEKRDRCYEVYWAPHVTPGEVVTLHASEMKLGRYALYIACGRQNSVVRSQLGTEEPEETGEGGSKR
jgi:hypothetical protein